MLTELLLGDYRKKVLSQLLLHPDADYHVRELARLTGTAAGSLHKELARLAGAGLLLRKEQGNQVRYQANRQCPIYPELAGLLRKTSGAAQVLGQALAPLQPALALIFGSVRSIGLGVQQGVRLGIQDYSRKERNEWGDTVLVQRAFAKRVSFQMLVENRELDNTFRLLSELRATPCLWLGSDRLNSLAVFGFYSNFEINIAYATHSDCTIDVEGLT